MPNDNPDTRDFSETNFFRTPELFQDPYPYHEWSRAQCPVRREGAYGAYVVTGFDEAIQVYHDTDTFSSCNTVSGPWFQFPVPLEGDDISDIIEQYRDTLPFSDQLPSFDPPKHTDHRGLLMRLITPKRLRENEEAMWGMADRIMDGFLADGSCEFIRSFAVPFTLEVVAELLGVPEEDRESTLHRLMHKERPSKMEHKPLAHLDAQFTAYIEDRRRAPRADIMTEMAQARFADGSLPPVEDVMRIAANLFTAGSETTARLMSTCLRILGDRPDLQAQVRADRSLVPAFVEEALRLESPLQGQFRLARHATAVGGVDLPVGACAYVMVGAANRDPRQFEDPTEFRLDRANGRQHVGFGHGIHTCAGAPLARAETYVTVERFLDRTSDLRVSEGHHGPPDARRYEYDPTYMLRGLRTLHLEFDPA